MKKELQNLLGSIPVDRGNEFKRKQRIHQGWWRAFVLAEEPGLHPTRNAERVCSTILGGKSTGKNFLSKATCEAVQETLQNRTGKSPGIIREDRLCTNLLSSQPMCFNLFGNLSKDRILAIGILRNYLPEIEQVGKVMFEYAPEERYTGDNSAFDVAIEVVTKDGNGLLGLECKYTDEFSYKDQKTGIVYGALGDPSRATYEQVFKRSDCFLQSFDAYVRDKRVNQLFRNQLIAESLIQNEKKYAFVRTGLVYHQDDSKALECGTHFQNMLRDGEKRFKIITIQDFIGMAQKLELDWDTRVWTMLVWARYSGNELSDKVAELIQGNG